METIYALIGGLYILLVLSGALNFLQSQKIQRIVQQSIKIQERIEVSRSELKDISERVEKLKSILKK